MQSRLFPLGGYPSKSAWTTSTALSDRFNLQAGIPINKGGKPPQGHAPDGKGAIVSFFPQGSINPGNKQAPKGGMSWYTSGPHWGSVFTKGTGSWEDDLTRAKEITFGYSVMFENGFQFNKGGKLPGVYGGVSEEEAVGCSGGRQEGRDGCFSSRLMWRESHASSILYLHPFRFVRLGELTHLPLAPPFLCIVPLFFFFFFGNSRFRLSNQTGTNGAGETYNYLPTSAHQPESYCQTGPESHCNPDYGDSSEYRSSILPPSSLTIPGCCAGTRHPWESKMADSMISLISGYSWKGVVLLYPWAMGDSRPADQAERCWEFERSVPSTPLDRFCLRRTRKGKTDLGICIGVNETGAIEIFVDGVSKLNVQGIELRTRGDSVFRGIQAQTFFG